MNANKDRLKEWIEKADHDLGTAIVINEQIPDYSDTLAFHCQQATEKYIKCLLEKNSIPFKKSHDLRYLLDLLDDTLPIDKEFYEKVMKLNAFSIEIRYPVTKIEHTPRQREESIETARIFREFVKQNLGFDFE